MMSSAKPKVHDINQRRQKTTKLGLQVTCIENALQLEHLVFEIWLQTIVFASWRKCAPLSNTTFLGPT